jgi:hypothetical protein
MQFRPRTATENCDRKLRQRTATENCDRELRQRTATENCDRKLRQKTATENCDRELRQRTATENWDRELGQRIGTEKNVTSPAQRQRRSESQLRAGRWSATRRGNGQIFRRLDRRYDHVLPIGRTNHSLLPNFRSFQRLPERPVKPFTPFSTHRGPNRAQFDTRSYLTSVA